MDNRSMPANSSWVSLLKEVWPEPSVKWQVQPSDNSSIHHFKFFMAEKSQEIYRHFKRRENESLNNELNESLKRLIDKKE
ncbi:MAG: hypothetical protein QGG87_05140 [Nitrospinota bacterium]|nr:hypothetical protein [Nitrospinota bacterium]